MSSTNDCQDPCCNYCLDLSPNAAGSRILIPYTDLPVQKPVPRILRDNDSTPGIVHIPTPDITDYIPSHYPKTNKPSNDMFECANPVRLGIPVPPGFTAKPPPWKDVKIVPDNLPARENIRMQNQWLWEQTQLLKDEKERKEIKEEEEKKKKKKKKRTRDIAPRNIEIEAFRKEEGKRGRNEGRSDSGMGVAVSFA